MRSTPQAVTDAIRRTLVAEGRYVDNPHDKGGKTMWGITEAVARKWGYAGDMQALPLAAAQAIYEQKYFRAPRFIDITSLSPAIAEELFDTGVNQGPATAAKYLQRALNAFNLSHTKSPLYPDLSVDGAIGPATLEALRLYLQRRGKEGELVMLTALNCQQGMRYIELCEARERNEEFAYGWFKNRVVI